jgi:hypothetical protein
MILRVAIYIFLLLVADTFVTSAKQLPNRGVHANIIYRFTKYVDWPDNKKAGEFIIGIVGESDINEQLILLTRNKRVGNQPIVIKTIRSESAMANVHLLFIAEDESSRLKGIVSATEGKPILLVTENYGLIGRGSCINMIIVGDHLKLEFNKRNIEKRNLKIASELLSLGTVVN